MKLETKVTRKNVEKLIEVRKENTFLNHLWNVLSKDFGSKGEIGLNEIKVWKQNMWNMTFYPVFTFKFDPNNQLTDITDRLNPIGRLFIGIVIVGFLYVIFPKKTSFIEFIGNWPLIILCTILIIIIVSVAKIVYRFEKKNQLEDIFESLNVKIVKKRPEREWSLRRILMRLFTYPFCLFLIGLNIFVIIPNEQYILALGTFGFVGFYLITDIKMILRNMSNNNHK